MRLIIELLLTIGGALSLSFFISSWWLVMVWVVAIVVSLLFIWGCMANPRGCGPMRWLIKLLGGGLLDRVLDTVDKKVQSATDREKIKGDIIKEAYRTRSDWMRAGGFWLMLGFALPLMFWFAAVVVYSVFWCAGCAYPQAWSVAALPAPLDEWAGLIIVSIFGVVGVMRLRG